MGQHDTSWVRTEMTLAQPAPASQAGIAAWVRKNLFATPFDSVLTILAALVVAWALPNLLNWVLFSAQWSRCRPHRMPDDSPGRHSAGRVVRRLLGFR